MIRREKTVIALVLVTALAGVTLGWSAQRAWADGIPSAPATLYYSGYVEDDTSAIDGPTGFRVSLWTSMTGGATPVCTTGDIDVVVDDGHFRVPLPADCTSDVHATPNLWVEVVVGGEALPRQHLGAVPYAVEAERATEASRHIETIGTSAISVGGLFVGVGASTTGDITHAPDLVGYRAARAHCQDVHGATAHMCTSDEIGRSAQLGVTVPQGWFAGTFGSSRVLYEGGGATGVAATDCDGWTSSTFTTVGAHWFTAPGRPAVARCDSPYPILCCD